jgi:hypothetical protein
MTDDNLNSSPPTMAFIAEQIDAVSPPHGENWDLRTIVDRRLHISRTASNQSVIFLEGDDVSFGNYGRFRGARHIQQVTDIDSGREFPSLLLASPIETIGGSKAMAHIVYEIASALVEQPTLNNEELLLKTNWVLGLLGAQSDILTSELQVGLAGECYLLRRLLEIALTAGVGASAVLERWIDEKRDFGAHGITVEVKTTAQSTRVHHIGSISQLEPSAENEIVYLYSIGIKPERFHDRKLTAYVDDVVRLLVTQERKNDPQAQARFFEKLASRGYDEAHRPLYDVGPGLMFNGALPARLYRASDLDCLRMSSFKNDAQPSMVRNIGYSLELPDGLDETLDEDYIFTELIQSPPIG